MKRCLGLVLVLALVGLFVLPVFAHTSPLSPVTTKFELRPVAQQVYWGSVNSNKFHYPSCTWAKKIKPSNLVVFKSRQEAANAGYVPCKVCKP